MGKPIHIVTETRDEFIHRKVETDLYLYIIIPILFGVILGVGFLFLFNNLFIAGIGFILGIFLYKKFYKKVFSKNKKHKEKHKNYAKGRKDIFSLKIFLIYGITFSIGFWVSTIVLPFIKISNLIAAFLIIGLILELSAKTCQMFLYNKPRITMDKYFILWVLIHSVVVYGVLYLLARVTISNQYLFFLAVGFGIALATHIIWRFMYKK